MPPATVAALIEAAAGHWRLAPGVEITLEANPSSVEAANFAGLAAAGVNRISLGLQALDDAALRFLGRLHDVGEGLAALDVAQRAFARVSFDLIYARPEQSADAWAGELSRALGFGTGHLSLYQLTIEAGTRFATLAREGALRPLDDDRSADLWALTREPHRAAGCPPTRSAITPVPARRAATTSPTGAIAITSASVPARTAGGTPARRAPQEA
jgi:oxygen-independent coproporphyrinogen-3 oxidase